MYSLFSCHLQNTIYGILNLLEFGRCLLLNDSSLRTFQCFYYFTARKKH